MHIDMNKSLLHKETWSWTSSVVEYLNKKELKRERFLKKSRIFTGEGGGGGIPLFCLLYECVSVSLSLTPGHTNLKWPFRKSRYALLIWLKQQRRQSAVNSQIPLLSVACASPWNSSPSVPTRAQSSTHTHTQTLLFTITNLTTDPFSHLIWRFTN